MQAKETSQVKVLKTISLLKEVITNPTNFKNDKVLVKALKSQGGIAKYENAELDIAACSLNTFKTTSSSLLERGFLSLDELRINAKLAVENALLGTKANKRTQTGLKQKIAELEAELDVAQRSNFLLTTIIKELRSKLKQMSEHDGSTEEKKEIYRTYNKLIEAELSYTLHGEL